MIYSTARRGLAVLAAFAVLSTASPAPAIRASAATKDISATMNWGTLRIGGGGFVSGIITGKKDMYARTDVGGAYKYNFEKDAWEQLFGFINEKDKGMLSVDSMCFDPTDDNTVYFLCGCAYFSDARTAIYKTTDGGKTFTVTDVTDLIQVHGNGYGRQCGESIAVDPDNPNIIYCGGDVTPGDSCLIKSTDGGKTWKPVKGYNDLGYYKYTVKWPTWTDHMVKACTLDGDDNYYMQNGVATISIANGKVYVGSSVIGANANGANLVVADVDTDKFAPLDKSLPTDIYPSRINKDADGNLLITYVAGLQFNNGAGGIYRYNIKSGKIDDISPVQNSFGACISDPKDAKKLYATTCGVWSFQYYGENDSCFGEWMYRSTDGGTTWEPVYSGKKDGVWVYDEELGDMTDHRLFSFTQTGGYDWIYNKAIHWSGSMMLDPNNADRIYVVSGNGVFRWDNIWGKGYEDSPVATFHPDGIEEVVSLDFVSTPDGLNLSAIGDYDGFVHESVDKIGLQYQPNMGSTSAIAVCPQNTDVWARVAAGDTNNSGSAYYTTDRGKTWKAFAPAVKGGKLAIAETAKGKYRVFNTASESGDVSYSDDWGGTWNKCEGIPSQYGSKSTMLLIEPEDPNTVYAYATYYNSSWHYSKTKPDATDAQYKFCISTDGGKTFTSTDVCMYDQCDSAGRIGYLGKGELILGGGWYGAYRASVKSGKATITKLDSVSYCKTLGYGAPEKSGGQNTVFMYGKPLETDPEGIYRSTDGGQTWVCINTDHLYGGTGNGNYLVGDMKTFGKVYMSTVGCGIVYGEIGDGTAKPPVTSGTSTTATTTTTTTTTTSGTGGSFPQGNKWGDTDCNGEVDVRDAVLLARIASNDATLKEGEVTAKGKANADVTHDGVVTTADLAKLLQYLASQIPASDLAK